MQVFSRRIALNFLNRNSLQALTYATGVHFNLTSAPQQPHNYVVAPFRNFATKPKGKDAKAKDAKQQNLLHYPAFPLEETLARLLKSLEPLLSKEELENHRKEFDVFCKCDGRKLQKLLVQAAAKDDNWLTERWYRYAYLQFRGTVVVNTSPGMSFPLLSFCSDEHFLNYVAKAIFCLVKFKETVDAGKFPVKKLGKFELDNSQFQKVYGTCRIPAPFEDKVQFNPTSNYCIICHRNHFYKLPVYSKALKPIHPNALFEELKKITAAEKSDGIPFGILSSDNRDNWLAAYKDLLAVKGNKEAVEEIQKSLFIIGVDGEVCFDPSEKKKSVLSEYMMYGRGFKQYAANRWYDKTIQLLFSRNGFVGFCYEHSPAEGQSIAMMVDYVFENSDNCKLQEGAEWKDVEPAKKLMLTSSPEVDKHIAKAKINMEKLECEFHMNCLQYMEYGKGFLKRQKVGPDAFVQMALQYAFYKLHKEPGTAYETAHLRIFQYGRTETIRSLSTESMAFVKAMMEPNSDQVRVEILRKALDAHRAYTMNALQGKAVDRHLLGLKIMAIENKLEIPSFYKLPGVVKSSHFRIGTSQVASVNDIFMCYGPMHNDGYACCYNPRENDIILACSGWRDCPDTCVDRFGESLEEALTEMGQMLCRVGPPKPDKSKSEKPKTDKQKTEKPKTDKPKAKK